MPLNDPPSYQPTLFVNREREIKAVTDALQRIAQGDQEQVRTIVFRGERGLGKSWLALHLHRSILGKKAPHLLPGYSIVSLLIALMPPPNGLKEDMREWHIRQEDATRIAKGDEHHYEALLQQLVVWVAEQLGIVRARYAPLRELSAWLAQDVKNLLDNDRSCLICLILDSVFETNRSFLDYLERYLLAAFAALPRVLIVMSSRGRPYLWKSPYLRAEREEQSLTPFTDEQVAAQIRQSLTATFATSSAVNLLSDEAFIRLARRVISLGGGYPLTNELLANAIVCQVLDRLLSSDQRRLVEYIEQSLDQDVVDTAVLQAVIDRLLEVIPADQRSSLRKAFDALCVLKDGFRENEMPTMLSESRSTQTEGDDYSIAAMRTLRDRLLATNLMRWQDKRYFLDEAVRTLLEQNLKRSRPADWRRLHEAAAKLYEEWANKYPHSREYSEPRAVYHRQVLQENNGHADA